MSNRYDYLIVGAGLYGAVFAREMCARGKTCLVIDRRPHAGGNLYCEEVEGIRVHAYGAHIFHTSNEDTWSYVQNFVRFNHFVNAPVAVYQNRVYNLPFNMNTFARMWDITTPQQAQKIIEAQRGKIKGPPKNLEEQAISLVGEDIFRALIQGYTEKQWGRDCRDLPAFIIQRLPVRFTYDNNYFSDPYQGIPVGGYNPLIDALLGDADLRLSTDFDALRDHWRDIADRLLFTGRIDAFYRECFGPLAYRSLRFEHQTLDCKNYQGCAVVNYTERQIPYTRIIEHKHFEFGTQEKTVAVAGGRSYQSQAMRFTLQYRQCIGAGRLSCGCDAQWAIRGAP